MCRGEHPIRADGNEVPTFQPFSIIISLRLYQHKINEDIQDFKKMDYTCIDQNGVGIC